MTLIGCRYKYGDVFSRALLIARIFIRAVFFQTAKHIVSMIESKRSKERDQSIFEFVPLMSILYRENNKPRKTNIRWLLWWCSPLPIPNREVKPTYADGTALQCGRVGSRLLLIRELSITLGSFFCGCIVVFTEIIL